MSFNPDLFLDTRTEAVNATRRTPFPEGTWRFLSIKALEALPTKNPKYINLSLQFVLEPSAELQQLLPGRTEYILSGRILVELNAQGGIASGADTNISLGQLREAVGLNRPGFSPRALIGAGPGLVTVRHRANETDPTSPNVDLAQFARSA